MGTERRGLPADARGNARARRLAPDRIAACQARRTRRRPCHARQTKRPAYQSDRPTARPLRSYLMNQGALCSTFQEGLNIKIKDPVTTPASLPCHADRIERRFAGPVSIGSRVELWLH